MLNEMSESATQQRPPLDSRARGESWHHIKYSRMLQMKNMQALNACTG